MGEQKQQKTFLSATSHLRLKTLKPRRNALHDCDSRVVHDIFHDMPVY